MLPGQSRKVKGSLCLSWQNVCNPVILYPAVTGGSGGHAGVGMSPIRPIIASNYILEREKFW